MALFCFFVKKAVTLIGADFFHKLETLHEV